MSGETVYILETSPLNGGGVATAVCFSAGLLDEAELRSTGNSYPARLMQAYTHETSIFEDNSPGQTSVSLGSATIANSDGRFDYLLDYAWDARPVTVKRGKQGAAYGTYVTEFVGSTTEITTDTNNLVLTLRDNSYKLIKPVQNNKFAGTGGAEGGLDLQNKFKPLLFGKARNLSPVWIDQALLTMQIHDGALTSVDAVYDRANAIKFYQNYSTYALLVAATIPPGYYGTCTAGGYIRLGAPPAGTLTIDAVGAFGTVTNVPELAKQLLTSRLGLTTGELDVSAFTQASTDASWAFEGLYYPEPQLQYNELIELLSNMIYGFWYVTRAGLISFKVFKFSTPVATIRPEDVMSLGKAPSPAPLFRVKVDYAKNPTVLSPSDFTIPKQLLNAYLDKMYHYVDTSVGSPDYSGAGKYHVFLNNTEVNDLGIATFRVPNGETWITIDQSGNIIVTAPPSTPASAVLRVNIGEFAWDEIFTVVKDSASPLNKIDLSLSTDRMYFDDNGQPSPSVQNVVATATGTNTTAPITVTAVDNLGNNITVTGGNTISIGNVSPSVLVQWVEVRATDANGIQQRKRFIVQHGNDAYAQGILGSYGSGVTFFFQGTAPTSGMTVNDIWVNTSDANKSYRWTGSTWAAISDTRIVDALTNAAGAQATADGKIKTYVSNSAPSGTFAIGDLWYSPTTQNLKRWNGSSWGDIVSTVGAVAGTNLVDSGFQVLTDANIKNSAVTLSSGGVLSGAGGGTVTLPGLGAGDLATKNSVDPSTSDVLTTGSIPPSIPGASFTYTSTTTSVTLSWAAMIIYRADGTTISISAGSQAITGLTSNTTYKIYPYVNDSGGTSGTILLTTTGIVTPAGTPGVCFPAAGDAQAASYMYLRGHIPMNTVTVATTASGTGGGGGGGFGCLHPEMSVGEVFADTLVAGDEIPAPGGIARIKWLKRKLNSEWIVVISNGIRAAKVTPNHRFYRPNGKPVRANELRLGQLLESRTDHVEVTGLLVERDTAELVCLELDDPHLYYCGILNLKSHNLKPI
jgi:hypothetical protein